MQKSLIQSSYARHRLQIKYRRYVRSTGLNKSALFRILRLASRSFNHSGKRWQVSIIDISYPRNEPCRTKILPNFLWNVPTHPGPAQGVGDIGPRLGRHFSWKFLCIKTKYLIKYLHVRGGKN
jgi:hypothetical protein